MAYKLGVAGVPLLLGATAAFGCVAADAALPGEVEQSAGASVVTSVTEGDYVIRSAATGKCIDVAKASTADGAPVQEYDCNGTSAQTFHVAPTSDGYFKIINVNSNKGLDIQGGSTAEKTPVFQWTYLGGANQQFKIVGRGGTSFSIQARHTDMAVDIDRGLSDNGTTILQYPYQGNANQLWTFNRKGDGGAGPVALTPPMGWNSWNKFGCNVSEVLIKKIADAMVSTGMKAAGYEFVNIDDCWQVGRDGGGEIVADPQRFPGGIKALADYIHGKGLKLGVYTDAGTQTCEERPGSYGHEQQDAATYARWGVDYIKEDWCHAEGEDPARQYAVMRDAIKATGRPMVLSICNWGVNSPWSWGPTTGNLWRTTLDIRNNFPSVLANLDANAEHPTSAGPGHWNDPDMLEVGNGALSADEDRSHFSLWALSAAPLIAGNDLSTMSAETRAILTNADVIGVDQDPAGVQGRLVSDDGKGGQVWSKPLSGSGRRAVVLFNRSSVTATVKASWSHLGLAGGAASVRDLWQHRDLGSFQDSYAATLAPHASVMVIVTGQQGSAPAKPVIYAASAAVPATVLSGGAVLKPCAACALGQKVGFMGKGGALQFNGVKAKASGLKTILIDYVSGESRGVQVSVNGGPALSVQFGNSGPDGGWDEVGSHVLQVPLNAGENTLVFSNSQAWAPDLSAIEVFE